MYREDDRLLPRHAEGVTDRQAARRRGLARLRIEIVRANMKRTGPDCDLILRKTDDHTLDGYVGLLRVCGLLRAGGAARLRRKILLQGRKERLPGRSGEGVVRASCACSISGIQA